MMPVIAYNCQLLQWRIASAHYEHFDNIKIELMS